MIYAFSIEKKYIAKIVKSKQESITTLKKEGRVSFLNFHNNNNHIAYVAKGGGHESRLVRH